VKIIKDIVEKEVDGVLKRAIFIRRFQAEELEKEIFHLAIKQTNLL